ncbi:MAG: DUF4253 domain-containing protein [Frankiaceae bacterium]|nr:DUF4253 domain-containing protein [Frankiaceae bacterium]
MRSTAAELDPWSVFVGNRDYEVEREHLPLYARVGDQHLGEELLATTQGPLTLDDVERWVFERLLHDGGLRSAADVSYFIGTRSWCEPDNVSLAFLPVQESWLAPFCTSYYGALEPNRREALCAALRQWESRYGAELCANWDTMLQLVVSRPPENDEAAWELAGQLLAVGSSLQMPRWSLALALPDSDAWFLHDRP